jgi:cysteinyl-tRNA synthetase
MWYSIVIFFLLFRIMNLELMAKFGSTAWRVHNEFLQKMIEQEQRQLQSLRMQIQEINWQRKRDQRKAGADIQQLEHTWFTLVSKNFEIERAIADLERQIVEANQAREQQLQGQQYGGQEEHEQQTADPSENGIQPTLIE